MAAWPAAYLLEEGRLHSQVFGHHVQAEEMPVDAVPGHGQSVQVLVPLAGQLEETPALVVCLATQRSDEGAALVGAGPHRLRPALPEETSHRRLVGQTETPAVLGEEEEEIKNTREDHNVRQLQADLDERVGADAQLLDASLSELPERKHVAVHVIRQRLGDGEGDARLSLNLTEEEEEEEGEEEETQGVNSGGRLNSHSKGTSCSSV
ncbi:hypothetical protein EYF80_037614 [Liparis tanakae]|uniref:Uncharacterized protein n=1 Tax=Liparis tanakae TaxID=230148 RepID=A0A4Z2GHE5_9TELE|nr:hypothetical protein EYF80_037614 [Liparis tanakae]